MLVTFFKMLVTLGFKSAAIAPFTRIFMVQKRFNRAQHCSTWNITFKLPDMRIYPTTFLVFTELEIPHYTKSNRSLFEKYAPSIEECVLMGFEGKENKYLIKCKAGASLEEVKEELNAVVEAVAATCDSGKEELAYA